MADFDLMIQDGFFYRNDSIIQRIKNTASDLMQKAISILPASSELRTFSKEVELLGLYSTDTIYRLKYDTMSYEYVSPSVSKLLGYSIEEIKTMSLRSLIVETKIVSDGMKAVSDYYELERNRKKKNISKWQADYLIKKKDGTQIWVSDVSYPWIDKDGNIIGSIGSLRDISDRIEAENRVKEELSRLALTDPLTGLANRREFFHKLNSKLSCTNNKKNNLSILLIDIDHFKRINDKYGHDIGDNILYEVSKVINSCLRRTDLAARIGGEEYGIVLSDTSSHGAYWVAERICNKISNHKFYTDYKKTNQVKCTVSIGISAIDLDATLNPKDLYKLADNRLYIAKNTGRNQVSIDEVLSLH